MNWEWRFLTEWEALIVLANIILGGLFTLLIEVIKMRGEIKDLLTEIRDALKAKI